MKPKILITQRILPEALRYLEKHADYEIGSSRGILRKEKLIEKIRDKEGLLSLLVNAIDKEVMDSAPRLKIIANCAVGFDNIDLITARKKGILVTNAPGVLTETTADLTWALIFAVSRRIPQADRFTREKRFKGWELDLFLGKEISGKRLGIVGMGRIGKAVALRAQAFSMETVYSDPRRLSAEEEKKYNASFLALEELLLDLRLLLVDIQACSPNFFLAQRLSQSFLIDNGAASGINQYRIFLHQADFFF